MSITTSGRALLAAGLILAATTSGPAPSARAESREGYVFVQLCNDSSDTVRVALAHYDKPFFGQLIVEGWGEIPAHACQQTWIARGAPLYTHARHPDDDFGQSGDARFCVPGTAFNRVDDGEHFDCPDDEASLVFKSHILPWDDTYRVTVAD